MAFQLFRGTEAQVESYLGKEGEVVVNLDDFSLHLMDGVNTGGNKFSNDDRLNAMQAEIDTLKSQVASLMGA